jgi:hypothetical protein
MIILVPVVGGFNMPMSKALSRMKCILNALSLSVFMVVCVQPGVFADEKTSRFEETAMKAERAYRQLEMTEALVLFEASLKLAETDEERTFVYQRIAAIHWETGNEAGELEVIDAIMRNVSNPELYQMAESRLREIRPEFQKNSEYPAPSGRISAGDWLVMPPEDQRVSLGTILETLRHRGVVKRRSKPIDVYIRELSDFLNAKPAMKERGLAAVMTEMLLTPAAQ